MKNERIYKYDNAKFVLIAFVVIGHLIDHYGHFRDYRLYETLRALLYSFHMPAFIFISGLFYSRKNSGKKIAKFISVFLVLTVFNFIVYRIMGYNAPLNFLNDAGIQWFMLSLATYQLIMFFCEKINKKLLLVLSLICSLAIGYTSFFGDYFAITRSVVFFPVFILGTLTDKTKMLNISEKPLSKIISAAVFTTWGVFIFFNTKIVYRLNPLFSGRNAYEKLENAIEIYGIPLRLLCFAIAIILTFSVISLVPDKKLPAVSAFGARTLQVYFWHTAVTYIFIKYGAADFLSHSAFGRLIYISIGIAVTLLLSLKPFEFPTKQISDIIGKVKKPESK